MHAAPDKRAPPGNRLARGALAGSGPGTSPCIDGPSPTAGMVVPSTLRAQTVRTTMVVPKDGFSRFPRLRDNLRVSAFCALVSAIRGNYGSSGF